MSVDIIGSLTTFCILFIPAFTISYVYFYIKRYYRIKEYKRRQAEKGI